MKKLNLMIIVLFLFSAFLFGVESEPSEIVGYVAYDCVEGPATNNNFIALPMDTGYVMASELGDAYLGQIDAISRWVPSTQSWFTASYAAGTWFNDFELDPGNSYMINVTEAIVFYSVGSIVPPIQYNLIEGPATNNNFIMVPLDRSDLILASGLGNDVGVVDAVSKWVAGTQSWFTASYAAGSWFNDFDIDIAMPLMVNITEAVNWPDMRHETRY